MMVILLIVVAVLSFLLVLRFVINPNTQPATSGLTKDGHLPACPDTPNCVSSEAPGDSRAWVAPLQIGNSADPIALVADKLQTWANYRVVTHEGNYLHVVAETPLLRYRDDVEFLFRADEPNTVHVRSASRIGRSDLGANRRRIESLREYLAP